MAQFAYPCRPPGPTDEIWYVDRETVDGYGAEVAIVRVKVGDDWRCATIDRTRPTAVDRMLIRAVVPSDADDCPACAAKTAAASDAAATNPGAHSRPTDASAESKVEFQEMASPSADRASASHGTEIQAAAISIQGERLIVVAVGIELVRNPAEADMVIDTLSTRFGRVPVLLMALGDKDAPAYYGDSRLVDLVAPLPVANMPWKVYSVAMG